MTLAGFHSSNTPPTSKTTFLIAMALVWRHCAPRGMLCAMPYVKICCIASREEARLAISAGASAIGLVSAMPSGPGPIADSLIAEIAAMVLFLCSPAARNVSGQVIGIDCGPDEF